jgi:hypothetical protein
MSKQLYSTQSQNAKQLTSSSADLDVNESAIIRIMFSGGLWWELKPIFRKKFWLWECKTEFGLDSGLCFEFSIGLLSILTVTYIRGLYGDEIVDEGLKIEAQNM